jgi:hypothetical protein
VGLCCREIRLRASDHYGYYKLVSMTANTMIDRDLLRAQATRFRAALEAYRASGGNEFIPFYPSGACSIVSWPLTMWLNSLGYTDLQYVQGANPLLKDNTRHGWLVVHDLIVDITADQFGHAEVIVEPSTPFHASFPEPERFDALVEVSHFNQDAVHRYAQMFAGITSRLSPHAA